MQTGKVFQKKEENFHCGHCGAFVVGNGYTNHCPKCLYSAHVDIFPGDRLENCGGLMKPVFLEKENGEEKLIQECEKCGFTRKNKVSKEDDFEALLALVRAVQK